MISNEQQAVANRALTQTKPRLVAARLLYHRMGPAGGSCGPSAPGGGSGWGGVSTICDLQVHTDAGVSHPVLQHSRSPSKLSDSKSVNKKIIKATLPHQPIRARSARQQPAAPSPPSVDRGPRSPQLRRQGLRGAGSRLQSHQQSLRASSGRSRAPPRPPAGRRPQPACPRPPAPLPGDARKVAQPAAGRETGPGPAPGAGEAR